MAIGRKLVPTRRGLKLCCLTTTIIFLISIGVILALSFTVFKPKQPEITAHPIGLENLQFTILPNVTLNVTLDVVVTVDNRNYGSFEYRNSTGFISYRGSTVAVVLLRHESIPARSRVNISASANLSADQFLTNPNFSSDLETGRLDLTSAAILHGEVSVMKFLKLHATAYNTCCISLFIISQGIESKCKSRIKL